MLIGYKTRTVAYHSCEWSLLVEMKWVTWVVEGGTATMVYCPRQ